MTGPLRAALRANRVTHAYLFSGPRGCGKTTSARILARCLNCAQGPTDTPCGECDSCRELATGGPGSLDVVEIDAASHGGVDDARDLRERATFAPVRDRYKIFIIDEAHMVSNQGFNALLKLVEEPPEHVKFVFATTEPERVIGTIRSRTHHYPFRLVPPDVLEPYLRRLLHEEGVEVGEGVLTMVMRAGGGSVRDTLSVLDQLIAGSIDGKVSYETAVALLGYTDVALLDESVDALAGGDGAAAYRVVERMVESGHDPRRFVEDLLQRLRDLLIIAVAGDGAADVLAGTPSDQFERMRHQAANWGPRALTRAADLTDEALRQMTGATSPRLQLELLLGRILVPPAPGQARPVEETPVPGTVGTQGGGAPREGSSQRSSFGAREAKEALARSRSRRPEAEVGAPAAPSSPPAASSEWAPAGDAHPLDRAPASASPAWPEVAAPAPSTARIDAPGAPSAPAPADRGESQARAAHTSGSDAPATAPSSASSAPGSTQSASAEAPAPRTGRTDSDLIRGRWSEVLGRLSSMSRVVWSLVNGSAQLGAVDGSSLVLLFPTEALALQLSRGGRTDIVAEAVYETTGVRVEVRAEIGQATGGPAVTAPSALASAPDRPTTEWVSEPPPFDRSAADPVAPGEADHSLADPAGASAPEEAGPLPAADSPAAGAKGAGGAGEPADGITGPALSGPSEAPIAHAAPPEEPAPLGGTAAPTRRALSVFTYDEDESAEPGSADTAEEGAPAGGPAGPGAPQSAARASQEPEPVDEDWAPAPVDEGWGPIAVPGGHSGAAASAPGVSPAPEWTSEEAPVFERPTTASAAMSGWSEAVARPGAREVSFESDSPSPRGAGAPEGTAGEAVPVDPAEDTPSIDDENIETSTRIGLPAVLDILGGRVIDEIYDEGMR